MPAILSHYSVRRAVATANSHNGAGEGNSLDEERIIEVEPGSALMEEALRLRVEVFVVEQGVAPELEVDELDATATHLVALRARRVVGTLRILDDGTAGKIGRVAVAASLRGRGIGGRLMRHAAAIVRARGFAEIVLHAQVSVKSFYQRLGYAEEGDVFDEAGIPHITMRMRLTGRPRESEDP
jgi:predicted GNAT family N-acyltransferase